MLTEKDVRAAIQEIVSNLDTSIIPLDGNFSDYGLDSLDQASLLLSLKERFGIDFPDDVGERMVSIEAILKYAADVEA